MACPVNASSTCALSVPVWRHWAMNRPRDRAVMSLMASSDSGIVTMATMASSGEIEIIMIITPMSVRHDVSSWLSVCCRLWATLSMSLVTRLEQVATGWLVDVAERQAVELVLDVGAQRYIVRCTTPASDVATAGRRARRRRRRGAATVEQDAVELAEVDAEPALEAVDDDVGGVAEDAGAEDDERDAADGQQEDGRRRAAAPCACGASRRRTVPPKSIDFSAGIPAPKRPPPGGARCDAGGPVGELVLAIRLACGRARSVPLPLRSGSPLPVWGPSPLAVRALVSLMAHAAASC